MQLPEMIQQVARKPGSLQARVLLAATLQQMNRQQAASLWEAVARLAAARGDFFSALAFCRLYLPAQKQQAFIEDLIKYYITKAPEGPNASMPEPRPHDVQLPGDYSALLRLAIQIGSDTRDLRMTNALQMPELPIFGDLPAQLFALLLQNMTPVPLQNGDRLIVQGTREQACYLLTHGQLRVVHTRNEGEEIELAHLSAPTLTGEISLLSRVSRRATVQASSVGMAWRIDANLLERLGRMHPALLPQIRTLIRMRLISNLMRSSHLFAELDEQERYQFLQSFTIHNVEQSAEVVRQGESGKGLFIVMHGEGVVYTSRSDGRRVHVASLAEGDTFGAVALLSGQPSQHTFSMPEGGILLQLTPQSYRAVCNAFANLDRKLRALGYMQY